LPGLASFLQRVATLFTSVVFPQTTHLSFELADPHLHLHQLLAKHLLTRVSSRTAMSPWAWWPAKRPTSCRWGAKRSRAGGLRSRAGGLRLRAWHRPHRHAAHPKRRSGWPTHPWRPHVRSRPHWASHHRCRWSTSGWAAAHPWRSRWPASRTWTSLWGSGTLR
jgi:hypothetical protein